MKSRRAHLFWFVLCATRYGTKDNITSVATTNTALMGPSRRPIAWCFDRQEYRELGSGDVSERPLRYLADVNEWTGGKQASTEARDQLADFALDRRR